MFIITTEATLTNVKNLRTNAKVYTKRLLKMFYAVHKSKGTELFFTEFLLLIFMLGHTILFAKWDCLFYYLLLSSYSDRMNENFTELWHSWDSSCC